MISVAIDRVVVQITKDFVETDHHEVRSGANNQDLLLITSEVSSEPSEPHVHRGGTEAHSKMAVLQQLYENLFAYHYLTIYNSYV